MASSLFCLLVLVLAFVGNVSAARTLPKSEPEFRAAMMRRLHKNGPPDLLAMKNAQATAVQRYTVTYTSAGYITSGLYSDSTCSTMQLAFGTPVNTCFVNEGYAYMFRLVQNSCVGAVVEYYFDKKCTQLAGTSDPTTAFPQCAEIGLGLHSGTVCSSGSQPWVPQQAFVQESFDGDNCAASVGYMAMPTGVCDEASDDDGNQEDTMITCQGGNVVYNSYQPGSGCSRLTSKFAMPKSCLTVGSGDDDDDDDDVSSARISAASSTLRRAGSQRDEAARITEATHTAIQKLNDELQSRDKRQAAAAKAHPAATVDTPAKTHTAAGPVPSMLPAPIPATTPGTTQTDDDVNYYDDDGDDRTYVYDDYVYIYPHDDQDFGYQFQGYGYIGFDDLFSPPLDPPPSVSFTPFPTTSAELDPPATARMYCQNAPAKHTAVFQASQTIEGVTAAQFNADLTAYTRTVAQAVAAVVTGATQNSLSDLVVADVTSSAATALNALLPAAFRLAAPSSITPLSGSGVLLSYKVTVQGATLSTDTLAGQLQTAVTSGSFDQYLNNFAIANGATGLESATSSSVSTQSLADGDSDDGSSSKTLGTGAIIGIVIGGVAGVVLLLAMVGYLCSLRTATDVTATTPAAPVPTPAVVVASAPAAPVEATVVAVDASAPPVKIEL